MSIKLFLYLAESIGIGVIAGGVFAISFLSIERLYAYFKDRVERKRIMEHNEFCLDCQVVTLNMNGHGGSPLEMYYEEGRHICKTKRPRVVTIEDYKA